MSMTMDPPSKSVGGEFSGLPKGSGCYKISFEGILDKSDKFNRVVILKNKQSDGDNVKHNPDDACYEAIQLVTKELDIIDDPNVKQKCVCIKRNINCRENDCNEIKGLTAIEKFNKLYKITHIHLEKSN